MSYKTYEVRVYANGDKHWYLNGKRHREDGPACEYADGTKYWYSNGKRHREDGPAMEYADGKCWYLNGIEYTEEGYQKKRNKVPSCAGKVVEIDGHKYRLEEV